MPVMFVPSPIRLNELLTASVVPLMSSRVAPVPRKFPATIVFFSVRVLELLKMPPPFWPPLLSESDRLFETVTLNKVKVEEPVIIPPPLPPLEFPLTVQLVRVTGPVPSTPPPLPLGALFPLMVLLTPISVWPPVSMPPPDPKAPAELPLTVLLMSVSVPPAKIPPPLFTPELLLLTVLPFSVIVPPKMPPPRLGPELPLTVLLISVSLPELAMPPPLPTRFAAWLPLTMLLLKVSVPRFSIPPPSVSEGEPTGARPPEIVRVEMETIAGAMLNTLLALLPLIVRRFAPGPVIVRFAPMVN